MQVIKIQSFLKSLSSPSFFWQHIKSLKIFTDSLQLECLSSPFMLLDYPFHPQHPSHSHSFCLSYLMEFLTRLKDLSESRLFIVPGWGMNPCREEGWGWRWQGCVSPWSWTSPPLPSPSAGGLGWEFNGHLLGGDRSAHTKSQIWYISQTRCEFCRSANMHDQFSKFHHISSTTDW